MLVQQIQTVTDIITKAFQNGNAVYFAGNGGSAADAQHLAAEFSGRFYKDRKALPSDALHCNSSYLTAVANDYSYDVAEWEHKGHLYLIVERAHGSGITHAGHCPCNTRK